MNRFVYTALLSGVIFSQSIFAMEDNQKPEKRKVIVRRSAKSNIVQRDIADVLVPDLAPIVMGYVGNLDLTLLINLKRFDAHFRGEIKIKPEDLGLDKNEFEYVEKAARIPRELAEEVDKLRNEKGRYWKLLDLIKEKKAYRKKEYLWLYLELFEDPKVEQWTKEKLLENYPHPELICQYLLSKEVEIDMSAEVMNMNISSKNLLNELIIDKNFMKEKGLSFFLQLVKKVRGSGNSHNILKRLIEARSFATNDIVNLVCEAVKDKDFRRHSQEKVMFSLVRLPGYETNIHGIRIEESAKPERKVVVRRTIECIKKEGRIPRGLAKAVENSRNGKGSSWELPRLIKAKEIYRIEEYLWLYRELLADPKVHRRTKEGLIKNYLHPELICPYLLSQEVRIDMSSRQLVQELIVDKNFMQGKGLSFFLQLVKKVSGSFFEVQDIFKMLIDAKSFATNDIVGLVCEAVKDKDFRRRSQKEVMSSLVKLPGYEANIHGVRIEESAKPIIYYEEL